MALSAESLRPAFVAFVLLFLRTAADSDVQKYDFLLIFVALRQSFGAVNLSTREASAPLRLARATNINTASSFSSSLHKHFWDIGIVLGLKALWEQFRAWSLLLVGRVKADFAETI